MHFIVMPTFLGFFHFLTKLGIMNHAVFSIYIFYELCKKIKVEYLSFCSYLTNMSP